MKLLPKRKAESEAAEERRVRIDEGIELARKVDAMREKLQDITAQNEKFVAGMEDELRRRTNMLEAKAREMASEVSDLEARKREAVRPLDEERRKLDERDAAISKEEARMAQERSNLARKQELASDRLRKISDKLSQVSVREKELARSLAESESAREDIVSERKEALGGFARQEKALSERMAGIEASERLQSDQSKALGYLRDRLEARERAVSDRERQVEDRYATLLRTEQRLKT